MSSYAWQHHPDAVWEEDPDELMTYLTSATQPEILVLAGTAAIIWQALPGLSTPALVAELATAFEVPAETIQSDVEAVVRDLEGKGLIHAVPA